MDKAETEARYLQAAVVEVVLLVAAQAVCVFPSLGKESALGKITILVSHFSGHIMINPVSHCGVYSTHCQPVLSSGNEIALN